MGLTCRRNLSCPVYSHRTASSLTPTITERDVETDETDSTAHSSVFTADTGERLRIVDADINADQSTVTLQDTAQGNSTQHQGESNIL